MIIDPQSISYEQILEDLKVWIKNKPDYTKWKDFYESSSGLTLIQLMAGLASYFFYHVTVSRRETYLQYATARSSMVAISETLGYSVPRGTNLKVSITFTPIITTGIAKFEEIGTYGNYYLYADDDYAITLGVPVTINAIVGELKEETLTIPSNDPQMFRFISPNVSDDILLYLNSTLLPTSQYITDLLNDKYVVLSNVHGAVDTYYLNSLIDYYTEDFLPGAVDLVANTIALTSSSWRTGHKIQFTNSGGSLPTPLLINTDYYVYLTTLSPKQIQLYDTLSHAYSHGAAGLITLSGQGTGTHTASLAEYQDSGAHQYKGGDILTLKYIELANITFSSSSVSLLSTLGTVTSAISLRSYIAKMEIDKIRTSAPTYHETQSIIKAREDFKKFLAVSRPELVSTNCIDTSPAVINVCYVKDDLTVMSDTDKNDWLTDVSDRRPFGISMPTISDPTQVGVAISITLTLNYPIAKIGYNIIQSDVRDILRTYEKLLEATLDLNAIENALEDLYYVNIARATSSGTLTLNWDQYYILTETITITNP